MKYIKPLIIVISLTILFLISAWAYNEFSMRQNNTNQNSADGNDNGPLSDLDVGHNNENTTSTDGNEDVPLSDLDEGYSKGDLAYDFTLQTFDGQYVTLSSLRGKIVVLNFWASWCGLCTNEMPDFQDLYNDITAQGTAADTVILSVNWTDGAYETSDTAMSFLRDNEYTFLVVSDVETDDGFVADLYNVSSIPRTFIIDKNGVITQVIMGSTDRSTLDDAIENART